MSAPVYSLRLKDINPLYLPVPNPPTSIKGVSWKTASEEASRRRLSFAPVIVTFTGTFFVILSFGIWFLFPQSLL